MKMRNTLFTTLISLSFAGVAYAAEKDVEHQVPPPRSGLIQAPEAAQDQGRAGEVVYPTEREIVDQTIRDMESMELSPEQYRRIKEIYLRKERQRATPYVSPAKPITRTLFVNLDPGIDPPVIRLTRGQQSSIVFSDHSGNPWMIENVSLNRQNFIDGAATERGNSSEGEKPRARNVLTLEPLSPEAYGNVTVTLRGLPTPVIFILTSGQKEVDMRIDAKISGHNPDAADQVSTYNLPKIDGSLSEFLDGVPPKAAQRLKVTGLSDTQAWLLNESLYIRTEADVQYPAFVSAARSTSGVSVYRFASFHSSVTFTTGGQAVTAFIE